MNINHEETVRSEISRRDFLKTSGAGLTFAFVFGPMGVKCFGSEIRGREKGEFTAWVRINPDNSILIYSPGDEMGQGSMTGVPIILAEEMDADWSTVTIETSPTEPAIFGSGSRNAMVTGGSRTIRTYFRKVRLVGAQVRRVLLDSVATEWQVPASELTTEPSLVVHAKSGRSITYGEIADFATVPYDMPDVTDADLKSPREFRLIGKIKARYDIPEKTDGSAMFSIDHQVPGMAYGVVSRSPVNESRPVSFNEADVLSMAGISDVVTLDHGIGIVGETLEAVLEAKDALEITWSPVAADQFNSEEVLASFADVAADANADSRTVFETGNAESALGKAVRRYQADYYSEHVNHAQLEPLNAIASVNEAGDGAEVWAGTQSPWNARVAAAQVLDVDPSRIKLNRFYSGGGFGRRLYPDYIAEAVQLSKAVKRPVKLMWTREDDIQYGFFRPMNLQRMTAGVDENGKIVAWKHTIVGDNSPGLLTGGAQIPHYDIANQDIDVRHVENGVRLSAWRAVAHPFNKFAIEAFLDEVASGESIDNLELHRQLMAGSARARKVVDLVAEMARAGGSVPEGRARGLAFAERGESLTAGIAEISLDEGTGKIRVHRAWLAGDFGIIVHPDNARAQMEGGFIFGLSSVLSEQITFKNGRVQQSNYRDYPIMTMAESPEIEVQFVDSDADPWGIGELGNPLAGGTVANAFAALTGKRLRHTPFTPERVSEVLGRS